MKKLITLVCTIFTLWTQAQTPNLTTDLVICMPMDNTNLAHDLSGNNNHGTLHGSSGLPTLVSGHTSAPNSAYYFTNSGQQYIEVSTSSSIDGIENDSELSISVWCKVTNYDPTSNLFPVIERWDGVTGLSPVGKAWGSCLFSSSLAFYNIPTASMYNQSYAVTAGTWFHYGVTYSKLNGQIIFYVNGNQVGSAVPNSGLSLANTSHGNIIIGYSGNANKEWADGAMDELRVYSRVLSASEMYALFSSAVTCSSTVPGPPNDNDGGDGNGCCLGNNCGSQVNALTSDYQISTAGNDFNFTDDGKQADKVQVGVACGNQLRGKFNVSAKQPSDPDNALVSVSVYGINENSIDGATRVGVSGNAFGSQARESGENRGVSGYAEGIGRSIGVYGKAKLGSCNEDQSTAGSLGSYGGYFAADSTSSNNYGVYAIAKNGCVNWAGYFDGDVNINGAGYITSGSWSTSDRRYKNDIKVLENTSEKLKKLNGYTYFYKTDEFKRKNFDKNQQIGLIAQELKEVFPQLVKEDKEGYLAVNYQGLIPALVQGFNEQQAKIEKQQQQIDELKAMVYSLSGNNTTNKPIDNAGIPVNLSDNNVVVLEQNVPNPFAENTTISYNLPDDFKKAQIIFTNNSGITIKTVDIKEKGQGILNVFASDLTHGIYTYSLIIDGKVVDSKKMIKE